MKKVERRAPLEQNQKLPAMKKDIWDGKNISRICLETPLKSLIQLSRKYFHQLDIKLGQFTEEELYVVLTKIESRETTGLDEIPSLVWKTRKFDDIILLFRNAVYEENSKEKWKKVFFLPFHKKGEPRITKNFRG